MVDLERASKQGVSETWVAYVPLGEAAAINKNGVIETAPLSACVAVVLEQGETIALAHFPARESFSVLDKSGKKQPKTFDQLMEELFALIETPSKTCVRASLYGGSVWFSAELVPKIESALKERGVTEIDEKGLFLGFGWRNLRLEAGQAIISPQT